MRLGLEVVKCRNSSVASCVCHHPAAQPSELSAGGALPIMHGGEFTTTPDARSRLLIEHILNLGCRCRWEENAVAAILLKSKESLAVSYDYTANQHASLCE